MTTPDKYLNERLDHLGIVSGLCQEIGLAAWLEAQDPGNRQQVSDRLAEFRLRVRLAETEQTIPDQIHKPTACPTMRQVFQYFEGIELLHVQTATSSLIIVLRLESVYWLILALLGPLYEKIYTPSG